MQKIGRPQDRPRSTPFWLKLVDVGRLGSFLALAGVEADALTFIKGFVSRTLNGGVVHEEIRASSIRRDETETLFGVEPLDGALLCHDVLSCVLSGISKIAMTFSRPVRHGFPRYPPKEGDLKKMSVTVRRDRK